MAIKEAETLVLGLIKTARNYIVVIVDCQEEWHAVKSRLDAGRSAEMSDSRKRQWSRASDEYEEFAQKSLLPAIRELRAEALLLEQAEAQDIETPAATPQDKRLLQASIRQLAQLIFELKQLLELSRFDRTMPVSKLTSYAAHDERGWLNPRAFYAKPTLEKIGEIDALLSKILLSQDAVDAIRARL